VWRSILVLAIGCSADYEVRELARDEAPPEGWLVVSSHGVGGDACVRRSGRFAVKRPKHATNVVTSTCYETAERAIVVDIDIPDAAWERAGWRRCGQDVAERAISLCKVTAPR
jgi:hypothetical protein